MFLHACKHYDLFSVVLQQSVVFESCVTRAAQQVTCADSVCDACVCRFVLNSLWTLRSSCTPYAHFHVLQPLS